MRYAALALALALTGAGAALAQTPDPAPVRTTPFPDVPRDHWAFDAVESLRQKGIIRGYPPAQTLAPTRPQRPAASRRAVPRRRR